MDTCHKEHWQRVSKNHRGGCATCAWAQAGMFWKEMSEMGCKQGIGSKEMKEEGDSLRRDSQTRILQASDQGLYTT